MSNKHSEFDNKLKNSNITSTSSIVDFLPYSTTDEVPEEFKKQLDDQGLPSKAELSKHTIVCGYLKNHDNLPFLAYLELSDYSNSIDNATLKYWTADGNYCWEPFNQTKKLTFEQLLHCKDFIEDAFFTHKSQRTPNGVLIETVDDPFNNPTLKQECVGDYFITMALCKNTCMSEYKLGGLLNFFIFPIQHMTIVNSYTKLIRQTTTVYPRSISKIYNIATSTPSLNQPQAYIVSIAQSFKESRKRISYLYESQKAYQNREKPLMIYKRVPSEKQSVNYDNEIIYLLTYNGNYIKIDPSDIVHKSNESNCFRILSYEKIVKGFPKDVSEETKKMVANPFPPELAIINDKAMKCYKDSLRDKSITQKTQE